MIRPSRSAKPNLAANQHLSPYGDIVEAAARATGRQQDKHNRPTPYGQSSARHTTRVAHIPRFGSTISSAAYSRLGLRVASLKEHGQITETVQDTLLNF